MVGYHTDAELPNYWAYAKNFVLQDSMFEGMRGWSLAAHLDLISEWSAACKDPTKVSTCVKHSGGSCTEGKPGRISLGQSAATARSEQRVVEILSRYTAWSRIAMMTK